MTTHAVRGIVVVLHLHIWHAREKRSSKATQIQATGAIWCLSDGVSYHPNQISPTWLMRILGEWQERMRCWWLREAGSRGSVELIHRRSLWKPSGGAEDWIMGPDISIEAGHKMGAKSITVGVRGKQSLGSRGSVCVHNAESTHPRRIAASLALLGFHGAADFRRWRQNGSAPRGEEALKGQTAARSFRFPT